MVGDERVRFCKQCSRNVYDLSAMKRVEAERFLEANGVSACVRLYRRADGTVLTSDCPVGVKKKRVHLAVFSVTGAALLAAGAVLGLGERQTCTKSWVVREHAVKPPEPVPTPSATPREYRVVGKMPLPSMVQELENVR
jgi:hypothetical protein